MPLTSSRRRFRNVAVATVVALVTAELITRTLQGRLFDLTCLSADIRPTDSERHGQYDSELGWVPHVGRGVREGSTYHVNSDTTRSNGELGVTPESTPLILAVGDSFTYGFEVNDAETWPAQLEALLGHRVVNAGVPGYGFDQTVLRAEQLVPKFNPDVLIVSFIPDDIARCALSVRQQAKPYFTVVDGQLQLQQSPVPPPTGSRAPTLFSRARHLLGYSHAVDLVMRRLAPRVWLDTPIEFSVSAPSERVPAVDPLQIGCLLVHRLAALARPGRTILLLAQHEQSLRPTDEEVAQQILRCAEREQLMTLDLFPTFTAQRESDPQLFRSWFAVHMTAAGNAAVAAALAAKLESRS